MRPVAYMNNISVPVSKLPQLVYETKQDLAQVGITSTIVGHVGDGNFHALLLFRTDEEYEIAKEAVHRMVKRAIALDGTCELTSDYVSRGNVEPDTRHRRAWRGYREKRIPCGRVGAWNSGAHEDYQTRY
jgi:FAD/FMN-containing dehydrogenase